MSKRFFPISRLLSRRILVIQTITSFFIAALTIGSSAIIMHKMADAYYISRLYGANESIEKRIGWLIASDHLYHHFNKMDVLLNTHDPIVPKKPKWLSQGPSWPYNIVIDRSGRYLYHPDKKRIKKGNFYEDIKQSEVEPCQEMIEKLPFDNLGKAEVTINGEPSTTLFMQIEGSRLCNAVVVPHYVRQMPAIMSGMMLLVIIALGLGVSYWVSRKTIRNATAPLRLLTRSANEVAKGNFQSPVPEIWRNNEVRLLRDSFVNMQQSLEQYIDQLRIETTNKAAFATELTIARNIQMSMVPSTSPKLLSEHVDLYAVMNPAKDVGGDLYDFFVRDDQLFFCIGDACDKGIPAAMLMTATINLFRAYASEVQTPDGLVSLINNTMSRNNPDTMFVTLFVGILNLKSGLLRYCNAGHNGPLLVNKTTELLPINHHPAVGVFSNIKYKTQEAVIEPQTTILLYTDGLSEATNADSKLFGNDRICNELDHAIQIGQLSPKEVIDNMSQTVNTFVGDAEQSDDITMLAIRLK